MFPIYKKKHLPLVSLINQASLCLLGSIAETCLTQNIFISFLLFSDMFFFNTFLSKLTKILTKYFLQNILSD